MNPQNTPRRDAAPASDGASPRRAAAVSGMPRALAADAPLATARPNRPRARSVLTRASNASAMIFPTLCVFDLDACFWTEEMYTLRDVVDPAKNVRGSLGADVGEGVVGAVSGRHVIRIHPGALRAMQAFARGECGTMRMAAASSADTPLATRIGRSALDQLEILPGLTARAAFAIGWPEGFEGNLQIGRSPPLSSDKSATHFPILRRETGAPYDEMLFFDDCGWEDHCERVARRCVEARSGLGPVTVRTPRGCRVEEYARGLALYDARARKISSVAVEP